MGVMAGQLEGKSRKYPLKIAAVLEISRTEKAGPEFSIREGSVSERLGNGGFPGPGEAVEPENMLAVFACQPVFDIFENTLPRPLKTPPPVPTVVSSILGVVHPVKKGEVCRFLHIGHSVKVEGEGWGDSP